MTQDYDISCDFCAHINSCDDETNLICERFLPDDSIDLYEEEDDYPFDNDWDF